MFYQHSTLQVNNNGLLSFNDAVHAFTPLSFPLEGTGEEEIQLIAPFWGDVDTRTEGVVSYRESTDQDILMRAQKDIRTAFPGQADNFKPRLVFIATWDSVGYYNNRVDKVTYPVE